MVCKRKLRANKEVKTFKTELVEKGYTQRSGVGFEETYSPAAIGKSIRIPLAIAVYYDETNVDDIRSPSGYVFNHNGEVVARKSFKQDITIDSTTEVEYTSVSKAAKETVRMKNYIQELGVVSRISKLVVIFYDNNRTIV
ncbi:hypothetical protein Sango_2427200 [Sesamum angolense]|uniref:Reverse transcriptase Ty1/copia-type domain-containing protein n=1 Tax=Sesamum angolense TaxID=2727404 RepID=A0AAE2BK05_9LAMI|nr:hypothetical protein Sango_2427200 [Sesamum angolense]